MFTQLDKQYQINVECWLLYIQKNRLEYEKAIADAKLAKIKEKEEAKKGNAKERRIKREMGLLRCSY